MIKNTLILLFLSLVFQACTSKTNVGKVDYRKVIQSDTCSGICPNNTYVDLTKKDMSFGERYRFSSSTDNESRLSLHLKTAYIKSFTEHNIRRKGNTKGEIAIIANAFEINYNNFSQELSFTNLKKGRVVYYNNDVYEGQTLNFNNIPIYGPTKYKGHPFVFRLSIVELDSNKYSKKMLNTLASVGSRAYPPASPILKLLNTLGSSFFDTDGTDFDFRYSMHFDANGGLEDAINHTYLEAGYYVFIRLEDRKAFVPLVV